MSCEPRVYTAAKWSARVLGTLILLTVAAFAVGEGLPNPLHCSIRENLLSLAMLTTLVGAVLGWKWEGIGGLRIVGSYVFFAIVDGRIPFNIVFGAWLLTGLLYLGCWWRKGKKSESLTSPS